MKDNIQRDAIINFFFELGQLKRVKHTGWTLAGVLSPDSVADHALRAAQIAFVLAMLEHADPYKAAMMCVLHDNAEARIGDHHKVAARYIDERPSEWRAFQEQIQSLPKKVQQDYKSLFMQYEKRTTIEGIVAKDADWLEMAFEARELEEKGFRKVRNWIINIEKALETDSAKHILHTMKQKSFCDWWKNLKKMTYKKLYT